MSRPDPLRLAALVRERLRGEVLTDEPLARHTSLGVGGAADLFVAPADLEDLQELLGLLVHHRMRSLVIGGGYNLLVRDGGVRGVVVSLRHFDRLEADSCRLTCGAGVANASLVRFARQRCLAGVEFLAGIPGTLGGALSMNAGAHGETILDRIETMTSVSGGSIRTRSGSELNFGYRFLDLEPGEVVVEATLLLEQGSAAEIGEKTEKYLAQRRSAQRVNQPSAGSFFRNPSGRQAWQLIDEAGLRGLQIGGAKVADEHANFLVNAGGATARDFVELASVIKEKVLAQTGFVLEEEVRIVGDD